MAGLGVGASLVSQGLQEKSQAMGILGKAADEESQRNVQNQQIQAADKAGKQQLGATVGATLGLVYGAGGAAAGAGAAAAGAAGAGAAGAAAGAGAGAASGATTGAALGPWGALIGGAIGFIAAGLFK